MNRKNHWRAKLMARMARDGDVESLAEMITELMETPDPLLTAPAVPAGPVIAAPAAQPLQAGSAMDPVVAAVVQAVENPMDAAPVVAAPAGPAAAPVEVSAPADQPVLVDCGPDILAALNRIIELLTASHGADCTDPARQTDADPIPEEASEPAANETAEAVEAAAEVAEVTEAVIGALGMEADPAAAASDPVEELVAEILEAADPAGASSVSPASPVEEAVQAEILSAVLEPDAAGDEETGGTAGASGTLGNAENNETTDEDDPESAENAENAARTADALRTALAAFRPQLQRMSPQDRQRFNADVAARMRKLTARSGKDRNPYAAIRGASARPRDDRALGQRIMATRNVNRRH